MQSSEPGAEPDAVLTPVQRFVRDELLAVEAHTALELFISRK